MVRTTIAYLAIFLCVRIGFLVFMLKRLNKVNESIASSIVESPTLQQQQQSFKWLMIVIWAIGLVLFSTFILLYF